MPHALAVGNHTPQKTALGKNREASTDFSCVVTFGAAGAVAATAGSPGVTVAKTGTGIYSLVFPRGVTAQVNSAVAEMATAGVAMWIATAINAGAGTGTMTHVTTVAADPASGDKLHLSLRMLT